MSMIAVGEPGSLLRLPDMYMRKMAVGPVARGRIDLLAPVAQNVEAIAEAAVREAHQDDKPRKIEDYARDQGRHQERDG
mgnify:CR=1 FL=1